ncbi:MmgE/PrpD family protein [Mangrovicella endophytica]|uniref:MmgE/PrpD family protein n=1 Tax=Mangrovicella endophytica TaxID=2066697 RepID=UPI000C9DC72C|nr:MmgE/PrpD family protein [Mangrovicella endophytica]
MTLHASLDAPALSLQLAQALRSAEPSEAARHTCWRLALDIVGLAVAARETDYVAAVLGSCVGDGPARVFGHDRRLGLYDAATVNGTAAHGEDFDDTFEGGPVHAGAVVVPAVLALADARGLDSAAVLRGIAVGAELMCRLSLVAPQAIHKAGFHPTAVIGALAAAGAASAALDLDESRFAHALGTAGSLASGIIEYLSDGSWTKRLHAGSAAAAGLRAALLAEHGFVGPRTVLEGHHGFFKAFAPSRQADFAPLLDGLGQRWIMEDIAFKPYACGTMTQPFVDCAVDLARQGIKADEIERLLCFVGEGTVHRLWEPIEAKRTPPNGYAAKFSTPFCVAVGFLDGAAGLDQFTDTRATDPAVRALAAKVAYEIDPKDEYPKNFTGRIRAELKDGRTVEARKPHMRGGAKEPLTDAELVAKFRANVEFGKASPEQRQIALERLQSLAPEGVETRL